MAGGGGEGVCYGAFYAVFGGEDELDAETAYAYGYFLLLSFFDMYGAVLM